MSLQFNGRTFDGAFIVNSHLTTPASCFNRNLSIARLVNNDVATCSHRNGSINRTNHPAVINEITEQNNIPTCADCSVVRHPCRTPFTETIITTIQKIIVTNIER